MKIEDPAERAQYELDDCIESLSVLDNAVTCGFLFDKHSLEMQKWIKEYKERIEYLRKYIDNARTNGK
jgi:ABC-type Fe3+-hydroxamate transport system substrate-binding protein